MIYFTASILCTSPRIKQPGARSLIRYVCHSPNHKAGLELFLPVFTSIFFLSLIGVYIHAEYSACCSQPQCSIHRPHRARTQLARNWINTSPSSRYFGLVDLVNKYQIMWQSEWVTACYTSTSAYVGCL